MEKEITKEERKDMASKLGKLGGKANVKKHGKLHMKEISKKGNEARWGIKSK